MRYLRLTFVPLFFLGFLMVSGCSSDPTVPATGEMKETTQKSKTGATRPKLEPPPTN
jgi:hypothetical protein